MHKLDPQKERQQFEYWVFEMEQALARFLRGPVADIADRLDYSIESLDELEAWLLRNYGGAADLLQPGEAEVLDGASRYIGEVLRRRSGGYWDISLKNPTDAFYGIPILAGNATPIAPLPLATAATERREGNFLSSVVDNIRRWSLKC